MEFFCSTTDKNNFLMWAHYAEQHRGAILELTPDIAHDSYLLISKPVKYSVLRPLLYRSPEDMVEHGFTMTQQESIQKIIDGLVYTKSLDWAYENEFRAFIPDLISKDTPFKLMIFYPQELTGVYLGCRMETQIKERVSTLAKAINPSVRIYQSETDKREYNLHYKEVI